MNKAGETKCPFLVPIRGVPLSKLRMSWVRVRVKNILGCVHQDSNHNRGLRTNEQKQPNTILDSDQYRL